MGEMKRLSELLDDMFRPLCSTCGMIPKRDENAKFCFHCEMSADWCQCDVADMCKCEGK